MRILIKNGLLVNEGNEQLGSIVINNDLIEKIHFEPSNELEGQKFDKVIDATNCYVTPGVIDDQVHFREPGLTYKGDIASESRAAVAGGVTSYMEMPNTTPPTTSEAALEDKFSRAAESSLANYSFFFGASNTNYDLLERLDTSRVCGVKLFMGSSTGDMLVDKKEALERVFKSSPLLVATHCEAEEIVRANLEHFKDMYAGAEVSASVHPEIRSAEACYRSSAAAVELATRYNSRLHLLHLSTAREMELLSSAPLEEKRITGEVCVHHLWFDSNDYQLKGNLIKWNPAIKSPSDREALREALLVGKLDVVATDHAPHTLEEKMRGYFDAPSGGPMVQHSLLAMLQMCGSSIKGLTPALVVEKMCHNPAKLFSIVGRGYLREGYFADIVIVERDKESSVTKENILYKCGWSPLEGYTFGNSIKYTFVNGNIVYDNGTIIDKIKGSELRFSN